MASNRVRLAAVRDYLREIWELGELRAKAESLPLAERLSSAAQAVAAGQVLGHLLDDESFWERLWELWRYLGALERELVRLEREQAQERAQAQV
jgi:hypothetical protein